MRKAVNSHRRVFVLSLLTVLYFAFLFLNAYYWHLTNTFIGIFQEVFTIPFMIGEVVLLIISIRAFIKSKFSITSYPFYSMAILLVGTLIIWGSFFY